MSREGERALLLGEETEEGEKRWERGGFGGSASRKAKMEEKKKKNADSLLETQLRWRLYEGKAHYSKTWEHEMKNACTVSPVFCMFAALCAPCVSYINRVEALHGDMRFYTCCQGTHPCSGGCGEEHAPEMCLCLETFCCFPSSVMATRYLLQDEMQIQNTKCDNCLFSTVMAIRGLSCLCQALGWETEALVDCAADMVYCSVCACMQTQHRNQIKHRNENPQVITPGMQNNPMLAPPAAVMQRDPNVVFVYPTVNHNGGVAQGVPKTFGLS